MTSLTVPPWFAVQTRPRHERMVVAQLVDKGLDVFLPTYRVRRKWSDRLKVIEQPLFEGYVFCRLDLRHSIRAVTSSGVVRLVSVAGVPAPIEEHEIATLQRVLAAEADVEPWPGLHIGQRVRIEQGALAGIEGTLESVRGHDRLILSVALLQRSVAVELDRHVVTPVETRPRSWTVGHAG